MSRDRPGNPEEYKLEHRASIDLASKPHRRVGVRAAVAASLAVLALAWLCGAAIGPPASSEPAAPASGDPATAASGEPAAPSSGELTAPATGPLLEPVEQDAATREASVAAPDGLPAAALAPASALPGLALVKGATQGPDGKLTATLADGKVATLSLDPVLQRRLTQLLADYEVPYGAIVALEPSTGRILALVEHSSARPAAAEGLASTPLAPAASVFKVVTAAALLEEGVSPTKRVCYHGGKHRLSPKLLADAPGDTRCVTFSQAMGHSANVAFAKLAAHELTPAKLAAQANRLLFGSPLFIDGGATLPSSAPIPTDPFGFANAAAGFSPQVRLTPLHGALLASIVGNDGLLVQPRLVDELDGVPVVAAAAPERLLSSEVSKQLTAMMTRTVSEGTARRAFRERRKAALPGIEVAGKTGSLNEQHPFRDNTWFVGFAPAEAPTIAVAALVVNDPRWRVRASYVAREALRTYLLGTTPYRPPSKEVVQAAAQ